MPLDQGGLWQSDAGLSRASTLSGQGGQTPSSFVSVSCGGRVEYDFALDQLSLRDSVSLVHQTPQGVADRFDCASLELNLNDPTNRAIQRNSPVDWLVGVVASGSSMPARSPTCRVSMWNSPRIESSFNP